MKTVIIAVIIAVLLHTGRVSAETPWTLEQSIRRMYQVAPEIKAARAQTLSSHARIGQSDNWPNPSLSIVFDDKLNKDLGQSGLQYREFQLSQPLPISGRLADKKAVAEARYLSRHAKQAETALRQEYQTAKLFHDLQLASANLQLATSRFDAAQRFSEIGAARFRQGDLSRLGRMRLQLAREEAHQRLNDAEGEYDELLTRYRAFLALDIGRNIKTVSLESLQAPETLQTYLSRLTEHPARHVREYDTQRARAQLALARAERLKDITLMVGQETERFAGDEDEVTRIGVTIPLPLWDRNSGNVRGARYEIDHARQQQQAIERDLERNLIKAHTHLGHLIIQAQHHREQVLEPSREVYELTRLSFQSGEVDILELIDAYRTYFSAQERYRELLHDGWIEAAELRLAAGLSLVNSAK